MRKRVALVIPDMEIGGIPKACVTLANQLSQYCDVTICVAFKKGEMLDFVPNFIEVDVLDKKTTREIISGMLKDGGILSVAGYIIKRFWYGRINKRYVKYYFETVRYEFKPSKRYDCAIAYHGMSIACLTATLYGIEADKKIAWIHGDHPFKKEHISDACEVYKEFNKIFCVSGICKTDFLKDFPELQKNTDVYYPLIDTDDVKNRADEFKELKFDSAYTNIVTVGRISEEKGQDMIPEIVSTLSSRGYRVKWYIVGDGNDRSRIEDLAKETKTEDLIYFTGALANPFPYMRECDIYCQPSYSEGYSLTILEALTLDKMVVASNIVGASEIVKNEEEAFFVNPEVESLSNMIAYLIDNPDICNKVRKNISGRDFSQKGEIKKILNYLESEQ